jgi:hypothetical protein
LKHDALVEFYAYCLLGKLICTLVCEYQTAGIYHITWNAKNYAGLPIATGGYICLMRIDHRHVKAGKLILIK